MIRLRPVIIAVIIIWFDGTELIILFKWNIIVSIKNSSLSKIPPLVIIIEIIIY